MDAQEDVISNADEILACLVKGEDNRHVGRTGMNERSSRSHTIFRIIVESRTIDNDNNSLGTSDDNNSGSVMVGTLNLVDLAGSESVRTTNATGDRLVEAKGINQSLLTLSRVIKDLADNGKSVNYRNSKLTRVLQPSLAGNTKLTIICCMNPSRTYLEESKTTLEFAVNAKGIRMTAEVNTVVDEGAQMKALQKELAAVRAQLKQLQNGAPLTDITNMANNTATTTTLSNQTSTIFSSTTSTLSATTNLSTTDGTENGTNTSSVLSSLVPDSLVGKSSVELIAHYENVLANMRGRMFIGGTALKQVSDTGYTELGRIKSFENAKHMGAMGRSKRHRETWCPAGSSGGGVRDSFLNILPSNRLQNAKPTTTKGTDNFASNTKENNDDTNSVVSLEDTPELDDNDEENDDVESIAGSLEIDAYETTANNASNTDAVNIPSSSTVTVISSTIVPETTEVSSSTTTEGMDNEDDVVTLNHARIKARRTESIASSVSNAFGAQTQLQLTKELEILHSNLDEKVNAMNDLHAQHEALLEHNEEMESEIQRLSQIESSLNREITTMQTTLTVAQEQVTVTQNQLVVTTEEKDILNGTVRELKALMHDKDDQITAYKEQVAMYIEKLREAENTITTAQERADEGEASAVRLEGEITSLREELGTATTEIGTLQSTLSDVRMERDNFSIQNESFTNEINALKAFINEQKEQYTVLQQQYNDKEISYTTLQTEFQTVSKQFDDLSSGFEELDTEYKVSQAKVEELTSSFETTVTQLHNVQQAKDTLGNDFTNIQNEFTSLQNQFSILKEENNGLVSKCTNYVTEIGQIKAEYAAVEARATSLQSQLESTSNATAESAAAAAEVQASIARELSMLRTSLSTTETERNTLRTTLDEVTATLTRTRADYETANAKASKLAFKLDSLNEEVDNVEQELQSSKAQIETLKDELTTVNAKYANEVTVTNNYRTQITGFQETITQQESQIKEFERTLVQYQHQITEAEATITSLRSFVTNLETTNTHQAEELETVQSTLVSTISERDALAEQYKSAQQNVNNLESQVQSIANGNEGAVAKITELQQTLQQVQNDHQQIVTKYETSLHELSVKAQDTDSFLPMFTTFENIFEAIQRYMTHLVEMDSTTESTFAEAMEQLSLIADKPADDITTGTNQLSALSNEQVSATLHNIINYATTIGNAMSSFNEKMFNSSDMVFTIIKARNTAMAECTALLGEIHSRDASLVEATNNANFAMEDARNLQTALDTASNQVTDLSNQIGVLHAHLQDATDAKTAVEKLQQDTLTELHQTQTNYAQAQATIAQLEGDKSTNMQQLFTGHMAEQTQLKVQLKVLQVERDTAASEVNKLTEILTETKSTVKDITAQRDTAMSMLATAESQLASLNVQLEKANNQVFHKQSEQASTTNLVNELTLTKEQVLTYQNRITELETIVGKIEQLQKELDSARSIKDTIASANARIELEKYELQLSTDAAKANEAKAVHTANTLTERNHALVTERDQLTSSFHAKVEEYSSLTKKYELASLELASLQATYERASSQLETVRLSYNNTLVALEKTETKYTEASNRIMELERTYSERINQLQTSSAQDIANVKATLAEQTSTLDAANSFIIELRGNMEEKEEIIEQHQNQINELQSVINEKDVNINNLSRSLANVRKAVQNAQEESAAKGAELNIAMEKLQDLSIQLQNAEEEISKLRSRVDALDKVKLTQAHITKMTSIKKERDTLKDQTKELLNEKTQLLSRIASLSAASSTAAQVAETAVITDLRNRLTETEKYANTMVDLKNNLETMYEESKGTVEELKRQITDAREESDRYKLSVNEARNAFNSSQEKYARMATSAAVLAATLNGALSSAVLAGSTNTEPIPSSSEPAVIVARAREMLDTLSIKVQSLSATNTALTAQLTRTETVTSGRAASLENELATVKAELVNANKTIRELEHEINGNNDEINNLQDRIEELETNITTANNRVTQMEKHTAELINQVTEKTKLLNDSKEDHNRAVHFLENENLKLMVEVRTLRTNAAGLSAANVVSRNGGPVQPRISVIRSNPGYTSSTGTLGGRMSVGGMHAHSMLHQQQQQQQHNGGHHQHPVVTNTSNNMVMDNPNGGNSALDMSILEVLAAPPSTTINSSTNNNQALGQSQFRQTNRIGFSANNNNTVRQPLGMVNNNNNNNNEGYTANGSSFLGGGGTTNNENMVMGGNKSLQNSTVQANGRMVNTGVNSANPGDKPGECPQQ